MAKTINLISDTTTVPNQKMLKYMMQAMVGDDVFGQDPTVNELEAKVANMFDMEAALYCPTGTMANQIALIAHTNRLDEVVCEQSSHIFQYETGGYAFNAGIAINPITGIENKLTPELIRAAIKPDFDWLPNTTLVSIENTLNKGGGTVYTLNEMQSISEVCQKNNLKLHLDGARLFNALTYLDKSPSDLHGIFDSISICLSKGLGAPIGTLLLGKKAFIKKSRKLRKVMGGGMRQIGYMAAAGIYALDHNIEDLKKDHIHAQLIGKALKNCPLVQNIIEPQTNIVICRLNKNIEPEYFIRQLQNKGIHCIHFGHQNIRFVTHRNVLTEDISYTCNTIEELG